jgi:hypothetical protein
MKCRALTLIIPLTLFLMPASLAAQVAGSGITNRIPIWTNSNTLGNSKLFQTGGKVGVGITTPAATLDVKGSDGGTGANAATVFQVSGGIGGPAVTNVAGGMGGAIQLGAGPGGRSCICNFPGGSGGSVLVSGGLGGHGFVKGGVGGQIRIAAGSGGTIAFAGTGGSGGLIQVAPGTGETFSSGKSHGGDGGSITLQPGAGGTGTGSPGKPGNLIVAPAGGKLGIGTATPTATLAVVAGGTTLADEWTTRSSRQFKTNIEPLERPLEKLERLQGVSYDRKMDGKHEIGVIAEDVAKVVPEVVSRDPETQEAQGVDYSRLAALLIEAVKSQQAELRTQQDEIQQLRARIEQLTPNVSAQ